MMRITYAPDLVEEAVLLAERTASIDHARAFRRERNDAYEIADLDRREAAFRRLHLSWFMTLGLNAPIERLINERPEISRYLSRARVLRALTRHAEGADLFDQALANDEGHRETLLVLRLRPSLLLDRDRLLPFVRHELMHVADMVTPAFGYQRVLPPSDDGPSADNMIRERYRVLWDVTIDGRLAREGFRSAKVRAARAEEFAAAFPMLGEESGRVFEEWFDRIVPTHQALSSFALSPRSPAGNSVTGRRCPLCRFPVTTLDSAPERLSIEARRRIAREHPDWRLAQGLCTQCLDLYEARSVAHDHAS